LGRAGIDLFDLLNNPLRQAGLTADQFSEALAEASQRATEAGQALESAQAGTRATAAGVAIRDLAVETDAAKQRAANELNIGGQAAGARAGRLGATRQERADILRGRLQGEVAGLDRQGQIVARELANARAIAANEQLPANQREAARLQIPGLEAQGQAIGGAEGVARFQLQDANRRRLFERGAPRAQQAQEQRELRAVERQIRRGERREGRERDAQFGELVDPDIARQRRLVGLKADTNVDQRERNQAPQRGRPDDKFGAAVDKFQAAIDKLVNAPRNGPAPGGPRRNNNAGVPAN
jgi:hypothetical protein